MPSDNYQQVISRLLNSLSLDVSGAPDKIGIAFEPDITVNLELFSSLSTEQVVLTCKLGDIAEFGHYSDVCSAVAAGNYYWMKANGCTLSVPAGSHAVYVQQAFPLALLISPLGVTDAVVREFELSLVNLVDCVKDLRAGALMD